MAATLPPDPWQKVLTYNDFPADEVISALQKEIRRGNTENAILLAHEMLKTGPEMEAKLWKRLLVISVEDIGMGDPQAPVLVYTLFKMHQEFSEGALDRPLFAIHAVRSMCSCEKDRSSDEMLNWAKLSGVLPTIPDYAIDMHTARGQEMGRDIQHFLKEGAKISHEKPDREKTYYERLIEILGME